ncbi:hypothetical protein DIPPA_09451 [Diplonema papillatum]|nr:hypothetical protein DIPPA_09451 [Diplonema papillatum]
MPNGLPLCPGGHTMEATHFEGGGYHQGWLCNSCGSAGRGGRWLCPLCGFDVCFGCRPRVLELPSDAASQSVFYQHQQQLQQQREYEESQREQLPEPSRRASTVDAACCQHLHIIHQLEARIRDLEHDNVLLRTQHKTLKEQAVELLELMQLSERFSIAEAAYKMPALG